MLIAIEGVDGAGKRTLTQGLRASFEADGKTVASLAFPRYGQSASADIAAEALHGGHGDLSTRCTRWPCCSRWTAPVRARRSNC